MPSPVCEACGISVHAGNAAIVLRSRLKVRVLKANMEKKARVDEKGIILTNGDVESSWKAVQYQVTAKKTNQTALVETGWQGRTSQI